MSSKKSKVQFSNESYAVSEMYKVPSDKPHTLPIYATSSYEMESLEHSINIFEGKKEGFVYSRYGNPTVQALVLILKNLPVFVKKTKLYRFVTTRLAHLIYSNH